jgi:tetratricopeptide (TPR) repeat protein
LPRKKHKHAQVVYTPAQLRARAERARAEGRYQQALELVKDLHKAEPTPEHRELLKDTYLGRARQLRAQGQLRDAVNLLEVAARLDEHDTPWRGRLAAELARSGEPTRALALMKDVPDDSFPPGLLAHLADAAVPQGPAGREALPPALRPDLDRVLEVFAHLEAGRDDSAREAFGGVGLRSPFAEWKLLLRGLQAYYQNDDSRALENWQRLDPERLPAHLAAPFRFRVDPAFRSAQPPATQAALQAQLDRLEGPTPLPQLRNLRAALADRENLAPAFRHAEALLPALRAQAPHLVGRLASCFYWAVVDSGPDDVLRYQRVFGKPADDPNFSRLHALAHDKAFNLAEAHRYWQLYEKEVAARPDAWPPGQSDRVRALIWKHMGDNAARVPDVDRIPNLPPFLRDHPRLPRPLDPPADACYEKSLGLAPDRLETYQALFDYHLHTGQDKKAEKSARRLLEKFPDHVEALEELAGLLSRRGRHAEELALLQRALKHNPLDRRLRERVSVAHMLNARAHAESGKFDAARQHYQSGLTFAGPANVPSVLTRWAACELKAGDSARAEELLAQARAKAPGELFITFVLLTEAHRLRLPPAVKKKLEAEFKQGLGGEPSGPVASALAAWAASLVGQEVGYHGLKTHVKKVVGYVERCRTAEFTEPQLVDLCRALLAPEARRAAQASLRLGQARFPDSPHFPYLQALDLLREGPDSYHSWRARPLLEEAQRLARARPPDDERDDMLEDIQTRLRALEALSPFAGGMLDDFFDSFGPDEDEWDEWDDDWEDWDEDEPGYGGRGRRRRR